MQDVNERERRMREAVRVVAERDERQMRLPGVKA